MTNDEIRMTNDERSPNDQMTKEEERAGGFRHSGFVILSDFVII